MKSVGQNIPRVVRKLPDSDVVVVKTSATHGMRQLRCPRCHGMAGPTRAADGRAIYRCSNCNAVFTSTKM